MAIENFESSRPELKTPARKFYKALIDRIPATIVELHAIQVSTEATIQADASLGAAEKSIRVDALRLAVELYEKVLPFQDAFYNKFLTTPSITDEKKLEEKITKIRDLNSKLPDGEVRNLGLDLAAERRRREFIASRKALELGNLKGVWSAYEDYQTQRDSGAIGRSNATFFGRVNTDLAAAGWTGGDVTTLFDTAYDIHQELRRGAAVNLNSLRVLLNNLQTISAAMGDPEAMVLYDQLNAGAERLQVQINQPFEPAFIASIKKNLPPTDQARFDELNDSLRITAAHVSDLKKQGVSVAQGNLTPQDKKVLENEIEELIDRNNTHLQIINRNSAVPQAERDRLKAFYDRTLLEAQALLGEYTGGLPPEYGQDIKNWTLDPKSKLYENIADVDALWNTFNNSAAGRQLSRLDEGRLRKLRESIQKARIAQQTPGAQAELSYGRRVGFLEIYLNRIDRMLKEIDTPGGTTGKDRLAESKAIRPDKDSLIEWSDYYRTMGAESPGFLVQEAKEIRKNIESSAIRIDKSDFKERVQALVNVLGSGTTHEEKYWSLLLLSRRTIYDSAYDHCHSASMTCDLKMLQKEEVNGLKANNIRFWTGDRKDGLNYEHAFWVKRAMKLLSSYVLEEMPDNFVPRKSGGSHRILDGSGNPAKDVSGKELFQEGWFSYGHYNTDSDNWKTEMLDRVKADLRFEMSQPGPQHRAEFNDVAIEVGDFTHELASLFGLRIFKFSDLWAAGSSPVGARIGGFMKYVAMANPILSQMYESAKRLTFMPAAAQGFIIPDEWWDARRAEATKHGNGKPKTPVSMERLNTLRKSYEFSRMQALTISNFLLEQELHTDDTDRHNLIPPYPYLLDLFFYDEDTGDHHHRRHGIQSVEKFSLTIYDWVSSGEFFEGFEHKAESSPPNRNSGESLKDYAHRLVNELDPFLSSTVSKVKSSINVTDWNDVGNIAGQYIKNMFRAYSRYGDPTEGVPSFLDQVREKIRDNNSIGGLGVDGNKSLLHSPDPGFPTDGKGDLRRYLLSLFPKWNALYAIPIPVPDIFLPAVRKIPIVGNYVDRHHYLRKQRSIVKPAMTGRISRPFALLRYFINTQWENHTFRDSVNELGTQAKAQPAEGGAAAH
jgi:hypothetical protein